MIDLRQTIADAATATELFEEIHHSRRPHEITTPCLIVHPSSGDLSRASDRKRAYSARVEIPVEIVAADEGEGFAGVWDAFRAVFARLSVPGSSWDVTGYDENWGTIRRGRNGGDVAVLRITLSGRARLDLTTD